MSALAFTVDITDEGTPAVREMLAGLTPDRVLPRLGAAGRLVLMNHLQEVHGRGNKLGGERTGYYADAARKAYWHLDADGVTIGTSQVGMSQHYFGGDLTEANLHDGRKYFTIPFRGEAHGHTASEFGLVVFWGKNGPYALALDEEMPTKVITRGPRKGQTVTDTRNQMGWESAIMFLLTKHVHFEPDESVFPTEADFMEGFALTISEYREQLKRQAGGEK